MANNSYSRRQVLKAGASSVLWSSQRSFGLQMFPSLNHESITFDKTSLLLDGKRFLLVSGEVHYSRSTRAMWPRLLDASKAMGINCIATYVFWNVHEPERGRYDFSGEADLQHFLRLCKERELHVFLRVGPYCCAEWNFGGLPPYLRDEPGITIRTMSQPYLDRVTPYFERLAQEVRPHLATEGGPVILVQVENEYANIAKRYGSAGQDYLRWVVALAERVGLSSVPTTTCEGGAPGAIETANGMVVASDRIAKMRKGHPSEPVLWSEIYPSWYQVWGGKRSIRRDARELARIIMCFIAEGGSGWNYYMWHGGTNFGRTSMYLQTTSYDFDAPLDEYGRPTYLATYLARLHKVLSANVETILQGTRAVQSTPEGKTLTVWSFGERRLSLLADPIAANTTESAPTSSTSTARLLGQDGQLLFDLQEDFVSAQQEHRTAEWDLVVPDLEWTCWHEPLPEQRMDRGINSQQPIEQLSLTKDKTDYTWYSTTLHVDGSSPISVVIPYGGDFLYAYVDGKLMGQSQTPLRENRGSNMPDDPHHPRVIANRHDREVQHGYRHEFVLTGLEPGPHRLDLLATALGMIKGDWQIGASMNEERKGIWESVLAGGKPITGWTTLPFLAKELGKVDNAPTWTPLPLSPVPLTWYKATFQLPEYGLPGKDFDFRLNASGLGKGQLFLNGHAVGRYWTIHDAAPEDAYSQLYYHVPKDWFEEENTLMLFEEQAFLPLQVKIERRGVSV